MAYEVLERKPLVPNVHKITIRAPFISQKAKAGQFVIVKTDPKGERIPMSLSDWNASEGTVTIVFLDVGTSTRKLAKLQAGDSLFSLTGPLGNPADIKKVGTVVCVGGCYGIGCLMPIVKGLKAAGNKIIMILEARSRDLIFLENEYAKVADRVITAAFDPAVGKRTHATDALKALLDSGEKVDRVCAIGCTYMMMIVANLTKDRKVETLVHLNPIMIDGTGMCGVCRVIVGDKKKFACVDGPEFNAHEVNWENLLKRKSTYLDEELRSVSLWECKTYG